MLTDQEIMDLPPNIRRYYFKQMQANSVADTIAALSRRYIPTNPDAGEIDGAIDELTIEHTALTAEMESMIANIAAIPALEADDAIELRDAIAAVSAAVAASRAAGEILALARDVVQRAA